jgi:DNA-binding transcriptional ArsR family regulator
LIYPVERRPDDLPRAARAHPGAVAALIGPTRAATLDALAAREREVSTSDLARLVGISTASASEHAKVLREAGLVFSRRERNRMLHRLSDLGLAIWRRNR